MDLLAVSWYLSSSWCIFYIYSELSTALHPARVRLNNKHALIFDAQHQHYYRTTFGVYYGNDLRTVMNVSFPYKYNKYHVSFQ